MPLKKCNVSLNFIQSFIDFETGFHDLHFCERGKWPTFLTFAPNAEQIYFFFSANCKLYLGDYRPGNDWKYQIKPRGQGDQVQW